MVVYDTLIQLTKKSNYPNFAIWKIQVEKKTINKVNLVSKTHLKVTKYKQIN